MRTIRGIAFFALMFGIGMLIAGIGGALFRVGYEFEAVVFLSGSYSIMGFIVGVREKALKELDEAEEGEGWGGCAPEGANVYTLPVNG